MRRGGYPGCWPARAALEPHDAVHPATFDGPLALQHESELDEELSRGCEVVNHDANVIHPLDSHVLEGKDQIQAAVPGAGRDLKPSSSRLPLVRYARPAFGGLPLWPGAASAG
jgi:hypothetical protein